MNFKSAILSFAVALGGCGSYPPTPNSAADIRRLPPSTPSLWARGLSDDDIPALSHLTELRLLDFGAGNALEPAKLTDRGLARLATLRWQTLETLNLRYCTNITDTGLVHIAKMGSVRWLSLMVCPRITDAGLPALHSMTNLTGLDLRGCPAVTDRGLAHLAAKTNWQAIWLGGCPNVTVEAVESLQRALPNAEVKKDEKEWSHHK